MSFSLNEVEAQAKKATRGAGYSWGMAEEAGRATAWLCAQGRDGVAVLAAVLDATPDADHCPLTQGTRLCDRAKIAPSQNRVLHRVFQPLLLLPFVGFASRQIGQPLSITWEGGSAVTDGASLCILGQDPAAQADLTIAIHAGTFTAGTKFTRATPDSSAWDMLSHYAHRTYAPATEESRRLGAGDSQSNAL